MKIHQIIIVVFLAVFVGICTVYAQFGMTGGGSATPVPTPSPFAVPTNYPGGLAQAIIDAGAGTVSQQRVLALGSGTFAFYGLSAVQPLAYQTLLGTGTVHTAAQMAAGSVPATILDGSLALPCTTAQGCSANAAWTVGSGASAGTWWQTIGAANTRASAATGYVCSTSTDHGCQYAQDLFYNNVPKLHTTLNFPPNANEWYLDYTGTVGQMVADTLYVGSDPTSSTVTLSVAQGAIAGSNPGVIIQNITVQKFAVSLGSSELAPDGANWQVLNNYVWGNHGHGIKPPHSNPIATNLIISQNYANENGQSGMGDGGSTGSTYSENVITQNNFAGVWGENGGIKVAGYTSNITVSNNTIKNNNAVGVWIDTDSTSPTITGNDIEQNVADGIRCEISHSCTIQSNTLVDNAQVWAGTCVGPHVPIIQGQDVCTGNGTATGLTNACSNKGGSGSASSWREIDNVESDASVIGGNGLGNSITSACAGIFLTQGSRNAGNYSCTGAGTCSGYNGQAQACSCCHGAYPDSANTCVYLGNNVVSYNTIDVHGASGQLTDLLGATDTSGTSPSILFAGSVPSSMNHNTYTLRSGGTGDVDWNWCGTASTKWNWTQFTTATGCPTTPAQEAAGTCGLSGGGSC